MGLIDWATSGSGVRTLMKACRLLPYSLACRLCDWAARRLARQREHPFAGALRDNMSVVYGIPQGCLDLDCVVERLLRNTLYSYVDLFRAAANQRAFDLACRLDPDAGRLIQDCLESGRGLLLVGAHMCSFDMLLLGLKDLFPAVQVLGKAEPKEGNCLMNELRRSKGLEVTPISIGSLRQAIKTLNKGGVVAVAADLPAAQGEELTFFGRRARLLVGHARLALRTGSCMLVGASVRVDRSTYRAKIAAVHQPPPTGNRECDVVRLAQASLAAVERFISETPEQWLMPHSVWATSVPEAACA